MAAVGSDLEHVNVGDREYWPDGPPHALFKRMRSECPVHWTESIEEFPDEAGFWSVTTADDVHTVSRDFRTYSSERGGITAAGQKHPKKARRFMRPRPDPVPAATPPAGPPSGTATA